MRTTIKTIFSGLVLVCLGACGNQSTKSNSSDVPLTEFGKPNLRGVWNFSSNTPMQRPARYGDREFLTKEEVEEIHARELARREGGGDAFVNSGVGTYDQFWTESLAQGDNFRTSLVVDPPNGRLPALVPGAVIQRGGLGPDTPGERPVRFRVGGIGKDGPEDRGLSERCLMGFNAGPPFMPSSYNNNVQIFQTENHLVIMTEMIHDARIVPLGGRPHIPSELQQWSGDSRGYWEGDTLVIETTNFTDKTQTFMSAGIGSNMKLVERFTRVSETTLEYKFTVTDPSTYTAPFTILVPLAKSEGEIYEYACHEGNYGMENTLSGARAEEKASATQ